VYGVERVDDGVDGYGVTGWEWRDDVICIAGAGGGSGGDGRRRGDVYVSGAVESTDGGEWVICGECDDGVVDKDIVHGMAIGDELLR